MKKKSILLALILAGTSCAVTASAGELSEKDIYFRDIPWYTNKADVEKSFVDSGATVEQAAFKDNILRMSGIDFSNTTSGSDRVDGGGIVGRYSGIEVAGYKPSDTKACYIFTLNEDGTINKSEDEAEFYFGWYTFDSDDYVDGEGVYNDLLQKLVSLYGEGVTDPSSDYFTTTTWTDSGSNQIRLLLGGKKQDYRYVTLGYIAADADARLDEMQAALDAEAAAQEAAERESNKDNVSGL